MHASEPPDSCQAAAEQARRTREPSIAPPPFARARLQLYTETGVGAYTVRASISGLLALGWSGPASCMGSGVYPFMDAKSPADWLALAQQYGFKPASTDPDVSANQLAVVNAFSISAQSGAMVQVAMDPATCAAKLNATTASASSSTGGSRKMLSGAPQQQPAGLVKARLSDEEARAVVAQMLLRGA